MAIRQITIIGTGLIGGSFALALKKRKFYGRIVGCDRAAILEHARDRGAIDAGEPDPAAAIRGSEAVILATPVLAILDLVERLGPALPSRVLVTDVGSTKAQVAAKALSAIGPDAPKKFLPGHPMAGKEQCGVEFADADLFQGAAWFVTPLPGQNPHQGLSGEFLEWVEKLGARIAIMDPAEHDELCAWISHLPQMISTALAASLVDEFGASAPLVEAGGRALREMTRISASPYSMWRDIAITNKQNLAAVLLKLEQRLAHLRENLDTRELSAEFERAHQLKKKSPSPPKLPRGL